MESPVNFSFRQLSFQSNSCRVGTLSINNQDISVNKIVPWDSVNKTYSLELFFELWIFDTRSMSFTYHNRFVGLLLNVTN